MTRREDEWRQALAADAVLAYVRDEDADVLNITDAVVAASPLFAALNLTAFARRAIRLLAECSDISVDEAVQQVVVAGQRKK